MRHFLQYRTDLKRALSSRKQLEVELEVADGAGGDAAVLVPLCSVSGALHCLFTVRSASLSTHAGQVSFPGGRVEPGESAARAALRETHEEVGLPARRLHLLGACDQALSLARLRVTPVVAFVHPLGSLSELTLCQAEVSQVFTVPLSELRDPRYIVETAYEPRGRMPEYRPPSANGHVIWGLTALILENFLSIEASVSLPSSKM